MVVETEVQVDNSKSGFVEISGLERLRFELSTPFSRFFTKALEAEVHLNKPQIPQLTQLGWQRMLAMMALYAFGKNGQQNEPLERQPTLDEIGKILPGEKGPLGRERVRQLIERGFYYLYQNSPEYLKQQYPDLSKPVGKEHYFMVDPTGTTRAIAGVVLKGATYQDLKDQGFSTSGLFQARKMLIKYSLSVPYQETMAEKRKIYKELTQDLKTLTEQAEKEKIEKERIRQVLDRIDNNFYHNHKEQFEAYCLTVLSLCRRAGLHLTRQKGHHSLILQVLDDLGIAYGEIVQEVKSGKRKGLYRTNFILVAQKPQAIARLSGDDRLKPLQENPVCQISGEKQNQLPTTWQLQQKEKYGPVGILLKNLDLPTSIGSNKVVVQQWVEGCPVNVFKITREDGYLRYLYPVAQEEQLKSHLLQKYQKLRGDLNPH